MAGKPYFPLYVGDWIKDPALSMCTPSTRGIWIDVLCRMHEMENGTMEGAWDRLACTLRCTVEELKTAMTDLYTHLAADVVVGTTLRVTCRRMERDIRKRKACSDAGKRGGGNPALRTYKGRVKHPPKGPYDIDIDTDNESESGVRKGIKGETVEIPLTLQTDDFKAAWSDWRKHRTEIHKPLKPTTMRNKLVELAEMGPARAVAAIRYSVSNGWEGIFEPKENGNGRGPVGADQRRATKRAAEFPEPAKASSIPIRRIGGGGAAGVPAGAAKADGGQP